MKNKWIYSLLFIFAISCALVIIFFDGTGDSGDSIQHYLFAKYAPFHPQLYLNHWAKPVYVLLASPFAQFGFIGIKVFNSLVSLINIFFTYKIVEYLNLKNAVVVVIILIFSPLFFILTFSGLTEPLFALFISVSLYLVLKKKHFSACIVISFLPFVRSEGLIIVAIYGLYFLIKKEWKLLPLLFAGHIVYSFIGFFVYHDLFWVFNKIPYARMSSSYGNGTMLHFVDQLIYVIGIPIYILFWIGIVTSIWKSTKRNINIEIQVLVFVAFISFLIAHSLFWYFGIFNSMGLKRVLVGVSPLIAIISLIGFNFISEEIVRNKKNMKLIFQVCFITYIIIFPFTPNPASIDWKKDLSLQTDQKLAIQLTDSITQNKIANHRLIFSHPYLSELFNIDYFDSEKHIQFSKDFVNQIEYGDVIIWDNWFALKENGITKESLNENPNLINLYNFNGVEKGGHLVEYSVYEKR